MKIQHSAEILGTEFMFEFEVSYDSGEAPSWDSPGFPDSIQVESARCLERPEWKIEDDFIGYMEDAWYDTLLEKAADFFHEDSRAYMEDEP
jgi:hypothetical protein